MKCLPECGYIESPNNILTLTRHVQQCSVAKPASEKSVIWSDGEMVVVATADVSEEDTVFPVTFEDFEDAPEVKPLVFASLDAPVETIPVEEEVTE